MAKTEAVKLAINGFLVDFPCKPYPTQVAMMDKILKAIDRHENALLESPTGSGKSLALLCSTLSWQRKAIESIQEAKGEVLQASECDCSCHVTGKAIPKPAGGNQQTSPQLAFASTPTVPQLATVQHQHQLQGQSSAAAAGPPAVNGALAFTSLPGGVVAPVQESAAFQPPTGALGSASPAVPMPYAAVPATHSAVAASPAQSSPLCTDATKTRVCDSTTGPVGDDDADFKPQNKKLRGSVHAYPKARSHVGIQYEDDDRTDGSGLSTGAAPSAWSCHLKSGADLPVTSLPGVQGGDVSSHYSPAPPVPKTMKQGDLGGTIEICGLCKCPVLDQQAKKVQDKKIKQHVPTIFYGTRTHKQITQIVHELRRTAFANVEMSILASREHLCVHPEVSKLPNKSEQCREHVKFNQCGFYPNINRINTHDRLAMHGLGAAWDIEDLVTTALRKNVRACPYYAARELAKGARIVFCPYNYLVDPKIRKIMEIQLAGNVVVLDEAHNIEDSARDSASFGFTTEDLEKAQVNLTKLVEKAIIPNHHRPLESMLASIMTWFRSIEGTLKCSEMEKSTRTWHGVEMVRELDKKCALNERTLALYGVHYQEASAYALEQQQKARSGEPNVFKDLDEESLHGTTTALLEGLFMALRYLLDNNAKHAVDYRIGVVRSRAQGRPVIAADGFRRRAGPNDAEYWTNNVHFWCMNPAVCFKELDDRARTIVLTSGTLAPIDSFSSELGVPFRISMEGNHVVPKSQVWVKTLAAGPNNVTLNATYKHTETLEFQDELGLVIKNVCETVPYGILCFLPSYSMMDKLVRRWRTTGLYDRLGRVKHVVEEPRHGRDEFEAMLQEFYDAISSAVARAGTLGGPSGALLFAVCRGKVSEGLDFANNNARAVITVGIPFPNFKDKLVELKRAYNNQQIHRGLLNGSQWYEIQAFRALNQALGRCIRHKADWGALLLIDDRFHKSQDRYVKGLSKWVRGSLEHAGSCKELLMSLEDFTQYHMARQVKLDAQQAQDAPSSPKPMPVASARAAPGRESCSKTPVMLGGVPMSRAKLPQSAQSVRTPSQYQHQSAFSHTGTTPTGPPLLFSSPAQARQETRTPSMATAATATSSRSAGSSVAPASVPAHMLTPYDYEVDACVRLRANAPPPPPPQPVLKIKEEPDSDAHTASTPVIVEHAYGLKCKRIPSPCPVGLSTTTTATPAAVSSASVGDVSDRPVYGSLSSGAGSASLPDRPTATPTTASASFECPPHRHSTPTARSFGVLSADADSTTTPASPSHAASHLRQSSAAATSSRSSAAAAASNATPTTGNRATTAEQASSPGPGAKRRLGAGRATKEINPDLPPPVAKVQAMKVGLTLSGAVLYQSVSDSVNGAENRASLDCQTPVDPGLRTDTIQGSDSDTDDMDIVEGSPQKDPYPSSIPESPPLFGDITAGRSDAGISPRSKIPRNDVGVSKESVRSKSTAASRSLSLVFANPRRQSTLQQPEPMDTGDVAQSHAASVSKRHQQEIQQQEEDDLLVQLTQQAELSQSPPPPPPAAAAAQHHRQQPASNTATGVYGGLRTKRKNARACPPTTSGSCAPDDASGSRQRHHASLPTLASAWSVPSFPTSSSAGTAASLPTVTTCLPTFAPVSGLTTRSAETPSARSGTDQQQVVCRRCHSNIAVPLAREDHVYGKKALQVPAAFFKWLLVQSPASLQCTPKNNTRQAARGRLVAQPTATVLLARPLQDDCDFGRASGSTMSGSSSVGTALKSWPQPDPTCASMDCMLTDDSTAILQPLVCTHCHESSAAARKMPKTTRSSRRATPAEEAQQATQSTVVGMRRLPLDSSAMPYTELWLLSTCCSVEPV